MRSPLKTATLLLALAAPFNSAAEETDKLIDTFIKTRDVIPILSAAKTTGKDPTDMILAKALLTRALSAEIIRHGDSSQAQALIKNGADISYALGYTLTTHKPLQNLSPDTLEIFLKNGAKITPISLTRQKPLTPDSNPGLIRVIAAYQKDTATYIANMSLRETLLNSAPQPMESLQNFIRQMLDYGANASNVLFNMLFYYDSEGKNIPVDVFETLLDMGGKLNPEDAIDAHFNPHDDPKILSILAQKQPEAFQEIAANSIISAFEENGKAPSAIQRANKTLLNRLLENGANLSHALEKALITRAEAQRFDEYISTETIETLYDMGGQLSERGARSIFVMPESKSDLLPLIAERSPKQFKIIAENSMKYTLLNDATDGDNRDFIQILAQTYDVDPSVVMRRLLTEPEEENAVTADSMEMLYDMGGRLLREGENPAQELPPISVENGPETLETIAFREPEALPSIVYASLRAAAGKYDVGVSPDIRKEDESFIRLLVTNYGASAQDGLEAAAEAGNEAAFEIMLTLGADPDKSYSKNPNITVAKLLEQNVVEMQSKSHLPPVPAQQKQELTLEERLALLTQASGVEWRRHGDRFVYTNIAAPEQTNSLIGAMQNGGADALMSGTFFDSGKYLLAIPMKNFKSQSSEKIKNIGYELARTLTGPQNASPSLKAELQTPTPHL